jgi:hypothetical protein
MPSPSILPGGSPRRSGDLPRAGGSLTDHITPGSRPILLLVLGLSLLAFAGDALAYDGSGPGSPTFTSVLPLNPEVQALVDSVSTARLEASVVRMAGFFTRHTVSDTTSLTTGIGAARKWVVDQLNVYSALHGGNLATGYFDFIATICTFTRAYRNPLGQQTGSVYPDRFFLVSGHLDDRTVGLCDFTSHAPGANDDASGTAATIEIAYLIGKLDIESSMIFMGTVGEDEGLFGSIAYANYALANGIDIAGMGTNDIIGNITNEIGETDSTRFRHFSGGPSTSSSRQLTRYFKLKGEAYQPGFLVDLIPNIDRPGRSGDHVPFYNNGYPAVRFTETLENLTHQHTGQDLPQFVSFPYVTRITRVNVAGWASLVLAPLPPAGLAARDAGNGTDVFASWNPNNEADLAGYRVAYRFVTGDSLYYQDILDAGASTSFMVTGLTANVPVYVSVSAYDQDFNESVFSQEVLVTPRMVPVAPVGFHTTSLPARIDLDWTANLELDLQGYNLYRSLSPGSGFTLLQFVPAPGIHFEDVTAAPATRYYYRITALDNGNVEGLPSATRKGRRVDLALPALVVDATIDGAGQNPPPDARQDAFYAAMLSGIQVSGEFDRADSAAAGVELSDADLGAHRLVIYHTDSRTAVVRDDSTHIRKYLQRGGKLLLSGSNFTFTFGGSLAINTLWPPGSFMHDVLKANETRSAADIDCIGADTQAPGYPNLNVDPAKAFLGRLSNQDVYIGPLVGEPVTEVLYTYRSFTGPTHPNHGKPDVIRVLGGGTQMVAFNIPLYFLDSLQVRDAVTQALTDLGELTNAIAGPESAAKLRFGLGDISPNPFNPVTSIAYTLDRRERATLKIIDVHGRLVRTLVDEVMEPGRYRVAWRGDGPGGRAVSSGVYFAELEAGAQMARRKLVLLK